MTAKKDDTHLYSTPSLMMIGFFLVSASFAVSASWKISFLPGGSVGESSSRVKTVTWWKRVKYECHPMLDVTEQRYLWQISVSSSSTGDNAKTGFPACETFVPGIHLGILFGALRGSWLVAWKSGSDWIRSGPLGVVDPPGVADGFRSSCSSC